MEYYNATSGLPPTVRLPPRDQAPPPEPESPAEKRPREAAERRTEILGKCPAELAAFACGASALAYHKQQEIRRQLKEEKATNVRFFDHGGSQAVGFEHLGRAWLVFRGTESYPETELFRDLSIDLFCLPMGWLPCHAGFRRAWAKLREPAREWLASVGKTAPLVITGHSLGGALALLAANEIALRGRATIEAVITFGAPRVGTWFWTYRYHRLKAIPSGDHKAPTLRDVTFRIRNSGDIITLVPPLLFAHCGQAISAGDLQSAPPREALAAQAFGRDAIKESAAVARFKAASAAVKRALPLSPLHLAVDLVLATCETAPQHFMLHYAPAFPDRPFATLERPKSPRLPTGTANWLLFVIRWAIIAAVGLASLWCAWRLYLMGPEITAFSLGLFILYALVPSAAALVSPPTPPILIPDGVLAGKPPNSPGQS